MNFHAAAERDGPPPAMRIVPGGERRQDSVANAFDAVSPSADVVLIHDAARPFVTADADRSDDRRGRWRTARRSRRCSRAIP